MKKIAYLVSLIILSASAIPAYAVVTTFKQMIDIVFINGILSPIVPLLIGLAVVVFIYGVLVLVFSEGGEKREDGKKFMFWGIIGIFVMVSVWGLVAVLQGTFNLNTSTPIIRIQ